MRISLSPGLLHIVMLVFALVWWCGAVIHRKRIRRIVAMMMIALIRPTLHSISSADSSSLSFLLTDKKDKFILNQQVKTCYIQSKIEFQTFIL